MKFIIPVILSFSLNARALLGGRTVDIEKDLVQLANRVVSVHADPLGCYTMKQISGDGVSIKEYINKSTDSVFLVRMNSRVPMSIKPLMSAADFEEYKQAKAIGTRIVQNLNRNHKNVATETARLKVFIDDRQMVHRTLMILKPDVPHCVANPESLP